MKRGANAQKALDQARGIIDLPQGAAAHNAIEPPSNGESLAQALSAGPRGGRAVMSNVTPIRGGSTDSSSITSPHSKRGKRKPKAGLLLFESGEFDGFSTQDVVNGLHGVCTALEHLVVDFNDQDQAQELSIAAKVLASIVQHRVASPDEVRL
jgi:hypothetical protein